jgi:hypothetical protein
VLAAITLMMDAASTSETSVNFYKTTQSYIPEDSHLGQVAVHCTFARLKGSIISRMLLVPIAYKYCVDCTQAAHENIM